MIKTKKELEEYLKLDNSWTNLVSEKSSIINYLLQNHFFQIKRYLTCLRKYEYYLNTSRHSIIRKLIMSFFLWKKYRYEIKLGVEIGANCLGKGVNLWHVTGGIIINPNARIGENCTLHGNNCIGNNGKNTKCPVIGDNVDIGFGAIVIGDVKIANGTVIAANAVVIRDILEENCIVAGVPAVIVKHLK